MSRGVKNSHLVYTKPDIEEYGYWNPTYSGIGGCVLIPHGSIKKLIGRELSFTDEPVELG